MQRRFNWRFFLISTLSSAVAISTSVYYLETLFSGYAQKVTQDRVTESLNWAKPVLASHFRNAELTSHLIVRTGGLPERIPEGVVAVFKSTLGKTEQLHLNQRYLDRFGVNSEQFLTQRSFSQSEFGSRVAQGPHWANFSSVTQVPTLSFVIPTEDSTLWTIDFDVDPFLAPFSTQGWQELAVINTSLKVLLHPKRTHFLSADPWSDWASVDLSRSEAATELPISGKRKTYLVYRSTFPAVQDFEARIRMLGGVFFGVLLLSFGFLSIRRATVPNSASDSILERITELQAIHEQDGRSVEVLGKITLGWASTYQNKGWEGLQTDLMKSVDGQKTLVEEDLENLIVITEHWKQSHSHRAHALEELVRGISNQKRL